MPSSRQLVNENEVKSESAKVEKELRLGEKVQFSVQCHFAGAADVLCPRCRAFGLHFLREDDSVVRGRETTERTLLEPTAR